jgi:GR25 family glycosyltransferase involved in LPS biosynthesis
MTALNACFPHKVCINLDRRPERWQRVQAQLAQHQIGPVERFSAVDGAALTLPPLWPRTLGNYGCLLSHLAVVQRARAQGLPHVLIFEDDVVFAPDFNTRFAQAIQHVPANWDMLFLGAGHAEDPLEVAPQIVQLRRYSYGAYAYALRASVYDAVIAVHSAAQYAVDENYMFLGATYRRYGFFPNLVWVEGGYSDAQERYLTYWDVKESVVPYGATVTRMLRDTVLVVLHHNPTATPAGTRNLHFLLWRYTQELSGPTMLVLEYGDSPSLDAGAFPPTCHYAFVHHAGPLQPGAAFAMAYERFHASKHVLVFLDSDLYVQEWDIKTGVGLCQQYECISPIRHIAEVSAADTHRIFAGDWQLSFARHHGQPKAHLCSSCCIFTAAGWRRVAEEGNVAQCSGTDLAQHVQRRLRVYDNAGWAVRLSPG